MSSRFPSYVVLSVLALCPTMVRADDRVLRVCADPNNLPFSDQEKHGFENRIAELIAKDLGRSLEYTWWAERKSFLRNSLLAGACDVVIGIPSDIRSIAVTRPYYRSTYVFVSPQQQNPVTTLTAERLQKLKIGIHIVGDDFAPPAVALARMGANANIVGYSLFGAFGEVNPPAKLIHALAAGEVDIAIVWGPLAGYFAPKEKSALKLNPVTPSTFLAIPFTYSISAGVRKEDQELRSQIDQSIGRQCLVIQAILSEFGVPKAPQDNPQCESSSASRSASLH